MTVEDLIAELQSRIDGGLDPSTDVKITIYYEYGDVDSIDEDTDIVGAGTVLVLRDGYS